MNAPAAHAFLDLSGTWRLESGEGRVVAGGRLSDNLFDVLPGESIVVTFTPDDPGAFAPGPQDFVLRDLHSSYASRRD